MFISLWQGVRDLMHDNSTTNATDDAKRFINWTIQDLANEYDWEFLRGSLNITASAGAGIYSLQQLDQLTATAETLYAYTDATADSGLPVYVYGKQIGASSNLTITADIMSLIGTATATGGMTFSSIDSIRKNTTSGTVTVVTSTGGVIATLSSTDRIKANDIRKINVVVDQNNSELMAAFDYNTYQQGNPNDSGRGTLQAYDIDFDPDYANQSIRLMNVAVGRAALVIYQRIPRYLMRDNDRSEFPEYLYPGIIEAAYEGWGLRYQDEADGSQAKLRYKELLQEIVRTWITGKAQKGARVMPGWYRRHV